MRLTQLKRKRNTERPLNSRPQAPIPLGAGQKIPLRVSDPQPAFARLRGPAPHLNATEKLETIASLVESSTGLRVRFAVTEAVSDPQLIPQCYQEARLCAEIRPWQGSAVVDAAGLGAYRFIIGASSSRHVQDFSRRTLGKAIEHDTKRNGELIGTLRTYFENRASVSLAA